MYAAPAALRGCGERQGGWGRHCWAARGAALEGRTGSAHPNRTRNHPPGCRQSTWPSQSCGPSSTRTGVDIGCHRLAGQIEVQDFLATSHIWQRDSNLGEAEERRARNTIWKSPFRQWQAARASALLAWFRHTVGGGLSLRHKPAVGLLQLRERPLGRVQQAPTWRSKRPGRVSALSSSSGRLVAAITTMPLCQGRWGGVGGM